MEIIGFEFVEGYWVIEIGCVEFLNCRFIGNNFYWYLQLDREIDDGVIEVYGIINEFLVDKFCFY